MMNTKYPIFWIVNLMLLVGFSSTAVGERYTVVNTDDSGDGSLRWAIEQANVHFSRDTVEFNIPSTDPGYDDSCGVWTVQVLSPLPSIIRFHPVLIDGYTQPEAQQRTNPGTRKLNSMLKIELDGRNAGTGTDGLVITAGSSTVRGLAVNRFHGNGILLESNGGSFIEGNRIGTDATGLVDRGNGLSGVCMHNSIYNTVGPDNVISFNGADGVRIEFGDMYGRNTVDGNMISDNRQGGIWIENVCDMTTKFTNNDMKGNMVGVHVIGSESTPTIEDNLIEEHTEAGVLIEDIGNALNKEITRNVIRFNANGIYVRSLSHSHSGRSQCLNRLDVTHNSIYSNTDHGVLNEDPTITVSANRDWWGDASGPYNEDTNPDGKGDAIAGKVICDTWSSGIVSISSVTDVRDTAGSCVRLDFQIYNLDCSPHTFEMTVTDSLGWHCLPNEFSCSLKAMTEVMRSILVLIPQQAEIGAEDRVVLSGVSTHDSTIFGSGEAKICVAAIASVKGDVNADGSVNILDAVRVVNIILGSGDPPAGYENWAADCTGDDTINVLDVVGIVNVILGIGECQP